MSIKLKGSSDGSVSFDAPADTSPSGSDITLVLPTTVGSAEQFLKNSGTAGTLEFSSMVETSTGVGIGTTSPSYALDCSSSAETAIRIDSASGSNAILRFSQAGTNKAFVNYQNGGGLTFGPAGSEAMRIDSSGNVGIGTTSPGGKLHIESAATTAGWQIRTDSVGLSNESGFYRDASDHYELVLRNGSGGLSFIKNDGGASTANLKFNVQGSERMRIDSSGNVGINVSNPSSRLHVNGTVTVNNIGSGAGTNALKYNTSNGRITYDASSARYKNNIRNSDKGLTEVLQLLPRKFEYKDSGRTDFGFIAEEVVEVFPELVTLDGEGLPEAVNYDRFVSVLTAALQEAIAKIETLETKVAALEAQ